MKLVIDIPESYFTACKDWDNSKVATIEQTIIAHGKPIDVRPTLILNNEVVYLTQGHIDAMVEYEKKETAKSFIEEFNKKFTDNHLL